MAAVANTTEAPFWIPELSPAEAAESAKCMERRELFTYVLCSLATWAAALVLTLIPRLLIAPCRDAIQQTTHFTFLKADDMCRLCFAPWCRSCF